MTSRARRRVGRGAWHRSPDRRSADLPGSGGHRGRLAGGAARSQARDPAAAPDRAARPWPVGDAEWPEFRLPLGSRAAPPSALPRRSAAPPSTTPDGHRQHRQERQQEPDHRGQPPCPARRSPLPARRRGRRGSRRRGRRPGTGTDGVRRSTVSVDSATWSRSAASRLVSESSSASRRASSDSMATMSPIDVAWASSARTRATLACWLATRASRSTTSSVASSTWPVRAVTVPNAATSSTSRSRASAGTRSTSQPPPVAGLLLDDHAAGRGGRGADLPGGRPPGRRPRR